MNTYAGTIRSAGWVALVAGLLLSFASYGGLVGMDRSGTPLVGNFAHWWMLWLGLAMTAFALVSLVVGTAVLRKARRHQAETSRAGDQSSAPRALSTRELAVRWSARVVLVAGLLFTFASYGGLVGMDRTGTPLVGNFAHWWMLWLGLSAVVLSLGAVSVQSVLIRNRRRLAQAVAMS